MYTIVDPDYGPNNKPWTESDLEKLRATGIKVLAYLNIGFTKEWREYWNWTEYYHPEWLYWIEHPKWPREYFVAYWHPSAWELDQ